MPVVFHNFKNYDSHVLCIAGFGAMAGWSFSVIPLTSEKYLSTMVNFHIDTIVKKNDNNKPLKVYFQIKFIDSYQFLSGSLESLVRTLP